MLGGYACVLMGIAARRGVAGNEGKEEQSLRTASQRLCVTTGVEGLSRLSRCVRVVVVGGLRPGRYRDSDSFDSSIGRPSKESIFTAYRLPSSR